MQNKSVSSLLKRLEYSLNAQKLRENKRGRIKKRTNHEMTEVYMKPLELKANVNTRTLSVLFIGVQQDESKGECVNVLKTFTH